MNDSLLNDGTVFLRAPEPYDISKIYEWENDSEAWSFGNQSAPFSMQNIENYINTYDADIYSSKQLRFIICDCKSKENVGCIDLYDFDPVNLRSAIGILIDKSFRLHGYGSRALGLLENFCVARHGIHQLWAIVAQDNTPSRKLFEKGGYTISGCLRSWIRENRHFKDAYIFQKLFP